ncbi:MAG TPA: VCBS repeat-containing protein [Acidobacteriaceae bacterium]|nr:VCBS repeat-containing protein [Acidobacteriaceae bacterium]
MKALTLRRLLLGLAADLSIATLTAQTLPSTVSITAAPSPLILPGTLTLTSTVNQVPVAGGVPTGTVKFFYEGTNSLGTAPLKVLPSSQAFPASASAVISTPGPNSVGVTGLVRTGTAPALVSLDSSLSEVTLYSFSSAISTPSLYSYTPAATQLDAIAGGFFLQPASSGIQSFLIHGSSPANVVVGTYSVFDGSVSAASAMLNPPKQTSASGCNCDAADNEEIAIDDFDADGYSDVGVLVGENVAGVVLNAGAGNPGSLGTFLQAPLPPTFCPVAITTGHFTAAPGAQLAVLGTIPTTGPCGDFSSTNPSTIYVFALNAAKTQLTQISSTTTAVNATSLAAADLNQDGKTDLVIVLNSQDGFLTAFGNGDGTFAAQSSLIPTSGLPSFNIQVTDLNGDGYPDVALMVNNATTQAEDLSILLNDGTGQFNKVTQITGLSPYTYAPASVDLNGDGLPDLAFLSQGSDISNVSILLNYAAAQATLTTPLSPLPAGKHTLTASYPGDTHFSAGVSPGLAEVVDQTAPVLSWPAPAPIAYGTALSSTELNATANVPGTFTYSPALNTILPLGPATLTATFTPTDTLDYTSASATQSLTVILPPVSATLSGPATIAAGEPATVHLTVSPFPHAVTVTVTLTFVPAPPNTVGDPMIVFSNNSSTYSPPAIPANTPAADIPLTFQSGSTAGTITVTTHVIDNVTNLDATPASLAPIEVTVPAAPPIINSGTLTRSGASLQVALLGLSSTRDMTQADFHFTPVAGKSLGTTDLVVPVTTAFQAWYQSTASNADGTTFTYTQPFTITGDASDIQSISVTLTNSQGVSASTTVQ